MTKSPQSLVVQVALVDGPHVALGTRLSWGWGKVQDAELKMRSRGDGVKIYTSLSLVSRTRLERLFSH